MEEVEIRAVIKYLCKKEVSPRKSIKTSLIHLGRSPLSKAQYKNGLLNLRGAAFEMMSGLSGQKWPLTMKLPNLWTIWSCATEGETCEAMIRKCV
jgi:hypothetical protein